MHNAAFTRMPAEQRIYDFAAGPHHQEGKAMIHIHFCSEGQRYKPYWKTCVGAGRANEGLRAAFQRQLRQVQEQIGFRYLRFHGLLHDDMFVVRENESGEKIYNFQYIDELFDSMLEMQIRPFVELSFFPSCLKGGDATQFWWKANITPPETWDGWCALIDRLIRHWLQRYGEAEVRTWYFEVWNEPNLNSFWDGTRSQYFSLYAATAQTIKSIDPHLRVGGPATSNFVPDDRFDGETEDFTHHLTHKVDDLDSLNWHGVWIEAFLDHCAKHHLPLDFVSTHPYPTDFAFDQTGQMKGRTRNVDSTRQDMMWLKQTVQHSAYPNAEIHLTEWSSSPSARDCTHDYLQEAAYLVKCNLDGIGLADSLSFWAFTDVFEETGVGDSIFHGGFGLINYQGIVKPSFHAYRMLSRLGDTLLYRDEHAFFTKKEGKLAALLYHYPLSSTVSMSPYPDRSRAQKELETGEAVTVSCTLTGLTPGAEILIETLDREHRESDLPVFAEAERWLDLYFSGEDPGFTPKLCLRGTPFRKAAGQGSAGNRTSSAPLPTHRRPGTVRRVQDSARGSSPRRSRA